MVDGAVAGTAHGGPGGERAGAPGGDGVAAGAGVGVDQPLSWGRQYSWAGASDGALCPARGARVGFS